MKPQKRKAEEVYDKDAHERQAKWAERIGRMRAPVIVGIPPQMGLVPPELGLSTQYVYLHARCSEIVLEALEPLCPLRWDRLIDVTIGLGAGFSGMGETCGAVTGAVIAFGLDLAHKYRDTLLLRYYIGKATQKFIREFRERFGSARCQDIVAPQDLSGYLTPGGSEMDTYEAFLRSGACPWNEIRRFAIMYPLPSEDEELDFP